MAYPNVEGRSDDILYLKNSQGHRVPVLPVRVRDAIGAFPEIKKYRVVHDDHRITATVVLRVGSNGEEVTVNLTNNRKARLESRGVECPEIRVRYIDRIERDPSTMGKVKLVQSNIRTKNR
ncbi:MAG: hypothetical protein LDL33_01460 [Desulfomonile sp.]|nr:hypothetical protein [Desulfomonile sp.]